MMKLISFELTKLIKSRKNIIVFILMIIAVIFSYSMLTALPGASPVNSYIWENNILIQDHVQNANIPVTDKSIKSFCEQGINLLEACRDKEVLSDDYLNWHLEYLDKIGTGFSNETQYQKSVDKYLLEHKVSPENSAAATNGFFLLCAMLSRFLAVFLVLFAILIGDIFNKEYKNGAHKLLLIQPYKRWKFIISKYLASLIYCIGVSIVLFCPICLFTGIKYGFGAFDYPMQLTDNFLALSAFSKFHGCNIVPAYQYFILFFIIAILLIVVFCAIATFASCVIKRRELSLSLIVIVELSILYICLTSFLEPTEWYNIFSYCNIDNILTAYVIDGRYSSFGLKPLTFLDGVAVMLLYTALFTGGSIALLKHKQFDN